MKKRTTTEKFCIMMTGIACTVAVYIFVKCQNIASAVGVATDHLTDLTDVEVEESIINRVVEQEATKQVQTAVCNAVKTVRNDFSKQIREHVGKAVSEEFAVMKPTMISTIKQKIGSINISDLVDEVKDSVGEKIEDRLEEIAKEHASEKDINDKVEQLMTEKVTEALRKRWTNPFMM